MNAVCPICKTALDPARAAGIAAEGLCPACSKDLLKRAGKPLQDFLESLKVPILLVDDDARVRLANRQALDLLHKSPASIKDTYIGDAVECVHARETGGCGKTVHCRTCTIRLTVTDTYRTGRPAVRVPAYADVVASAKAKPVRFFISTEKVGELVMLRIDEARDASAPAVPRDPVTS